MNRKAFTLVELLIVVAIIGVLSTIGVPTYKKMIQKARQSEAKTFLGAIARCESAFYGEHHSYGNSLKQIGFDVDEMVVIPPFGNYQHQGLYSVGFPAGIAGVELAMGPCTGIVDIVPVVGTKGSTRTENVYVGSIFHSKQSYCLGGSMDPAGQFFTATSTGLIAPGLPPDSPPEENDVWTIDQNRNLSNVQSGVR